MTAPNLLPILFFNQKMNHHRNRSSPPFVVNKFIQTYEAFLYEVSSANIRNDGEEVNMGRNRQMTRKGIRLMVG